MPAWIGFPIGRYFIVGWPLDLQGAREIENMSKKTKTSFLANSATEQPNFSQKVAEAN